MHPFIELPLHCRKKTTQKSRSGEMHPFTELPLHCRKKIKTLEEAKALAAATKALETTKVVACLTLWGATHNISEEE